MHEDDVKVIQAVRKAEEADDLIRLSTGVTLKAKPVSATTIIAVLASFKRPRPPVIHVATMGRDMENPLDPDYISMVRDWEMARSDALLTVFILNGTELHNKPDDMPGPSPDKKNKKDWVKKFSLLNLPMLPEDPDWRYLMWVKTLACGPAEDSKMIQEVVGRLSGVSKSDVRAAEEFPGSEETP